MTTPKCVVCTCEDVTDLEVEDAVAAGYADLEGLKRYTGLATGPCQGKACVAITLRILAERFDVTPEDAGLITLRPPLRPVPLRYLAGDDEDGDAPGPPARSESRPSGGRGP